MGNFHKYPFLRCMKKIIAIYAALITISLLLMGCSSEAATQKNEPGEAKNSSHLKVKDLDIIDKNGSDIYPGDNITVIIELENQGESKTGNVQINLKAGSSIDMLPVESKTKS